MTVEDAPPESPPKGGGGLADGPPQHPDEVAVIGEAKLGGQVGQVLLAGGHAVNNDRRTDLVAEPCQGRSGRAVKHAAEVERRAPEVRGQRAEVEGGRISGDGFPGEVDEPAVRCARPGTAGRQATGSSPLDKETDEIRQARVEFRPVDPRA